MTDPTPHRAKPEQWADVESRAADCQGGPSCVIELRARVEALEDRDREDSDAWTGVRRANSELRARIEALEAGATCPRIVTGDEGTSHCALAEQQAAPPPEPAPAGSLVDAVARAIAGGDFCDPIEWRREARSAIRVMAAAARSRHLNGVVITWEEIARWLERESQP